jgi:hypothetical protein
MIKELSIFLLLLTLNCEAFEHKPLLLFSYCNVLKNDSTIIVILDKWQDETFFENMREDDFFIVGDTWYYKTYERRFRYGKRVMMSGAITPWPNKKLLFYHRGKLIYSGYWDSERIYGDVAQYNKKPVRIDNEIYDEIASKIFKNLPPSAGFV